jgi:hypothetical protein
MPSRSTLTVALIAAVVHFVVIVMLFGIVFGLDEGGGAPGWLNTLVAILGAPLFILPDPLLDAIPEVAGEATLFLVMGANSLLWGACACWLWARRHSESTVQLWCRRTNW